MGNDMFNDEQLADAEVRARASGIILSREAFLRRLHVLADTVAHDDFLLPSEVDLSAHDAALRAENARLRDVISKGAAHLIRMKDGAHNCAGCGLIYDEWAAALAPAPSEAVREAVLPDVPPADDEADALIRLAYDARFGGGEWQRRAYSYLWRDRGPSPLAGDAVREAAEAVSQTYYEIAAEAIGEDKVKAEFSRRFEERLSKRRDAARGGE